MRLRPAFLAAALMMAGCSAQPDMREVAAHSPLVFKPASPVPTGNAADIKPAPGGYKLTELEQKLDCPKLLGQMKVRIANMRSTVVRPTGTVIGQTVQSAVAPIYGGTRRGIDPGADLQLDRAKLEAFNARLAEKKCKPLDIDAELRGEAPVAAPAKAPTGKSG